MVIDTSAVVGILLNEPGAAELLEILKSGGDLFVAAPTRLECEMVITTLLGADGLLRLDELLDVLSVETVPFGTTELAAARFGFLTYGKGRHPAALNFGDCFSYALAMTLDQPLLFKGDDFSATDVRVAVKD